MQATQPKRGDLRTLKRGGNVSSPGAPASSAVPPPKFNYKTRVVLPGGVLFALLALIAYSARDSLLPAREVTVVPVVLKDLADDEVRLGFTSVQERDRVVADGDLYADVARLHSYLSQSRAGEASVSCKYCTSTSCYACTSCSCGILAGDVVLA